MCGLMIWAEPIILRPSCLLPAPARGQNEGAEPTRQGFRVTFPGRQEILRTFCLSQDKGVLRAKVFSLSCPPHVLGTAGLGTAGWGTARQRFSVQNRESWSLCPPAAQPGRIQAELPSNPSSEWRQDFQKQRTKPYCVRVGLILKLKLPAEEPEFRQEADGRGQAGVVGWGGRARKYRRERLEYRWGDTGGRREDWIWALGPPQHIES